MERREKREWEWCDDDRSTTHALKYASPKKDDGSSPHMMGGSAISRETLAGIVRNSYGYPPAAPSGPRYADYEYEPRPAARRPYNNYTYDDYEDDYRDDEGEDCGDGRSGGGGRSGGDGDSGGDGRTKAAGADGDNANDHIVVGPKNFQHAYI